MNKLIIIVCLLAFGCKKDKDNTVTHIYLSGASSGTYNSEPTYWNDSIRNVLDRPADDDQGDATSIVVAKDTVYISGYYRNNLDDYVPCYWKNGIRTDLPGYNSYTYGITVSNNDVYVVGYTVNSSNRSVPCYWKNGTRIDLPRIDNARSGRGQCIQVVGTDVYVGGFADNTLGKKRPCYWKNGQRTLLSVADTNAFENYVFDILIDGADVYLAGVTFDAANIHIPCYWKNGQRTDLSRLSGSGIGGAVNTIALQGNTVYAGGYTFNENNDWIPCYWKNTLRTDLGMEPGMVNAMCVDGGDVYFAGMANRHACYWKNEQKTEVHTRVSHLQSIYITH